MPVILFLIDAFAQMRRLNPRRSSHLNRTGRNRFMRKTKIVATIGPASSDPAVFAAMCKAGVNVARLNFSHGTHEEQLAKIHMIKKVREELDLPIAIMLDTKGPEYRTGTFKNGKVHINDGDLFTFTTRDVEGSSTIVSP